jgi:hypothetical protein
MIAWLSLSDEERRITLEQASIRSGIQSKAIEKDWWVTLTLKALFNSEFAQYCIFKGGTSLSKGWKLIQRFSEDIDIALDPEAFDMKYIPAPSHSYVKKLKRAGCNFTSEKMTGALQNAFNELGLPEGAVLIEAEEVLSTMPDKDPQAIYVRYTSLYDPHPYLADQVKIEFGVRSLKEPFTSIKVHSLLTEFFPNEAYQEIPFEILAVEPRKTLLEKAFLLHEKLSYGFPESLQDDRQSRHLYDLVQLMETEAGTAALNDIDLYNDIVEHRRHYIRLSGVDYDKLLPAHVSFIPLIETLQEFQNDYEEMQASMIYGSSHDFEELIRRIKILNGRFRLIGTGLSLDAVIEKAVESAAINVQSKDYKIFRVPVELKLSSGEPVKYQVTLLQKGEKLELESIIKTN